MTEERPDGDGRRQLWPLGWGLLIAWGICVLFHDSFASEVVETRVLWIVSAAASAAAFTLVCALPAATGPHKATGGGAVLAAGVGMAGATCLLASPLPIPLPVQGLLVALAGVLDSLLTVGWGSAYARLGLEGIERCAALCVVPIAVCFLAVALLPSQAVGPLAALLPLSSAALLAHGLRDAQGAPTRQAENGDAGGEAAAPAGSRAGFARVCLATGAFSAAIAMLWTAERMGPAGAEAATYNGFAAIGVVVAGLLVAACATWARKLDLGTFFQLVCPMLFGGLLLASLGSPLGSLLAFGDAMSCQVLLGLAVLVHFAELGAVEGRPATRRFAAGQLCLQAGLLVGYLLPLALEGPLGTHPVHCAPFSLGICTVLVVLLTPAIAGAGGNIGHAGTEPERDGFEVRCRDLALRCSLTPRETQVFELLAQGHSLPYIRNCLSISKSTAGTHAQHIYKKCGVHSREELMGLVARQGRD